MRTGDFHVAPLAHVVDVVPVVHQQDDPAVGGR